MYEAVTVDSVDSVDSVGSFDSVGQWAVRTSNIRIVPMRLVDTE